MELKPVALLAFRIQRIVPHVANVEREQNGNIKEPKTFGAIKGFVGRLLTGLTRVKLNGKDCVGY